MASLPGFGAAEFAVFIHLAVNIPIRQWNVLGFCEECGWAQGDSCAVILGMMEDMIQYRRNSFQQKRVLKNFANLERGV
jgi:hypothetical protein